MFDTIVIYTLGVFIVNSLLLLWFFSPFKTTISEIFLKKSLMPLEFDDFVYNKNKVIGKLISCWICCSFWLSLIVGIAFSYIFSLPLLFCLITFFSYPSLCYIFYSFIRK